PSRRHAHRARAVRRRARPPAREQVTAGPSARGPVLADRLPRSPLRVSRGLRIALLSVGVFLAARLVTSAFMLWLTTQTGVGSEAGVSPSFATLSSVW